MYIFILYILILGGFKYIEVTDYYFYPPPDEVGAGGFGVATDVCPSGSPSVPRPDVRISFPEQNSVTRAWSTVIFATHIP